MNINSAPVKILTRNVKANEKRPEGGQQREVHRLSLKEWKQKVYPFPDADMPEMLEKLLKLKLIELLECKRLEKIGKVDGLNYWKYHRIMSHPIQKCFVLKELIMKLAKERKIDLDFDDVVVSNLATFACRLPSCMSLTNKQGANTTLIQFFSLEPIQVQLSQEAFDYNSNDDRRSTMDEKEGWTMVTCRRWKKRREFPFHLNTQESRKAQNQIQPWSRGRSDKRQERLGTKMYDDSAQTQKLRNLITLEEFFPRKFFQNDSAKAVHTISYEIHDEMEDVDHGGLDETLSSLKELQSQIDEVEPLQSSTSPKEVLTQALEKPMRYTPLPTRINKPKNVVCALQT